MMMFLWYDWLRVSRSMSRTFTKMMAYCRKKKQPLKIGLEKKCFFVITSFTCVHVYSIYREYHRFFAVFSMQYMHI